MYHRVHLAGAAGAVGDDALDATKFFKDVDGGDVLSYEVTPSYNGIEAKKVAADGIILDVLWAPLSGALITLDIRAIDGDQQKSGSVTIQVVAADAKPIAETYVVDQDAAGNFFDVTVSRRQVKNILEFRDPINPDPARVPPEYGFAFVDKYLDSTLGTDEVRPNAKIGVTGGVPYIGWTIGDPRKAHAPFLGSRPTATPNVDASDADFKPDQAFVITSTGSITVSSPTVPFIGTVPLIPPLTGTAANPAITAAEGALGDNPWLFLTVKGTTDGGVTIDYWAWVDPDGPDDETDVEVNKNPDWKKAATGKLKIDIE